MRIIPVQGFALWRKLFYFVRSHAFLVLFTSRLVQAESVLMHRVLLLAQNIQNINQNYYFRSFLRRIFSCYCVYFVLNSCVSGYRMLLFKMIFEYYENAKRKVMLLQIKTISRSIYQMNALIVYSICVKPSK